MKIQARLDELNASIDRQEADGKLLDSLPKATPRTKRGVPAAGALGPHAGAGRRRRRYAPRARASPGCAIPTRPQRWGAIRTLIERWSHKHAWVIRARTDRRNRAPGRARRRVAWRRPPSRSAGRAGDGRQSAPRPFRSSPAGNAAYLLRLRLPDTAGQLLERTSVRDGRLIGQTFTPIRKDTR